MKKLLVIFCSLIFTISCIAQTGTGWSPMRSKINFKDSTYHTKNAKFNSSVWIKNLSNGLTETVNAGGTTTLIATSDYYQTFTGTLAQSVVLPDVTTCTLSTQFYISNLSTGVVTVKSSGGNNIVVMAGGTECRVNCILLTGTTAASWDFYYSATFVASSKRLYINNSLVFSGTDGTTQTFPGVSTRIIGASDTATMLVPYIERKDTATMLVPYVNHNDTATMLSKYLRKTDTTHYQAKINLKVNTADSTAGPGHYASNYDMTAGLAQRLSIGDTASMLTPYINRADTAAMLTPYATTAEKTAGLALKVNIADTAAMLDPIWTAVYDTIPIGDIAPLHVDTASIGAGHYATTYANSLRVKYADIKTLFTFGVGGGNPGDTLSITDSTILGSFYNGGAKSIVVDTLRAIMKHGAGVAGRDTLAFNIVWGKNMNDGPTGHLSNTQFNCGRTGTAVYTQLTTGNFFTAFDHTVIPPGYTVYGILPYHPADALKRKPRYFEVSFIGHYQ